MITRIQKIGGDGCRGSVRIGDDGGRSLGMVGCESVNTEDR